MLKTMKACGGSALQGGTRRLTDAALGGMKFDPDLSTSELWGRHEPGKFVGKYQNERALLDYSYHTNYTPERQLLQDRIVDKLVPPRMEDDALERESEDDNPWLVFSAGAMGAGKTRTIHWMAKSQLFPLQRFAFLDHDAIRYMLPEMWSYQILNPDNAGRLTQKEAGFIAELATRRCIDRGVNCLVDGSLKNSDWYLEHIPGLKQQHPSTRFGIIHVYADPTDVRKRAKQRERVTGRHVPEEVLESAMTQVPLSINRLAPVVDVVATIDNSSALPPRFDSLRFSKGSRLAFAGQEIRSPPWDLFQTVFKADASDSGDSDLATPTFSQHWASAEGSSAPSFATM